MAQLHVLGAELDGVSDNSLSSTQIKKKVTGMMGMVEKPKCGPVNTNASNASYEIQRQWRKRAGLYSLEDEA